MDEYNLTKTYKIIDTESSELEDAKEAFGKIVPHVQKMYPSVHFDPVELLDAQGCLTNHLVGGNQPYHLHYKLYGGYASKGIFGISTHKYLILDWQPDYYSDTPEYKLYWPSISTDDYPGPSFQNFEELDQILERFITRPLAKKTD